MAIGPWGGFSNGAIPASALSTAGGVRLRASTAAQCNAWIAACAARGVALKFNEGYRDLEGQRYWLKYYGGDTRYAAWPGTSNHGWGQAVDINANAYTDEEMAVIVEEGKRFGMIRNIALESWHFADVGTVTASLTATPFLEDFLSALTDSEQTELLSKVRWLFDHIHIEGAGYDVLDVIRSHTKPVYEALIEPSEATKPYRPIDVIVSHVKDTLTALRPPKK
jgi:hypothetical protein